MRCEKRELFFSFSLFYSKEKQEKLVKQGLDNALLSQCNSKMGDMKMKIAKNIQYMFNKRSCFAIASTFGEGTKSARVLKMPSWLLRRARQVLLCFGFTVLDPPKSGN